jgi:hypothetical protein
MDVLVACLGNNYFGLADQNLIHITNPDWPKISCKTLRWLGSRSLRRFADAGKPLPPVQFAVGEPGIGSRSLLRKPLPPVPFAVGKPELVNKKHPFRRVHHY